MIQVEMKGSNDSRHLASEELFEILYLASDGRWDYECFAQSLML